MHPFPKILSEDKVTNIEPTYKKVTCAISRAWVQTPVLGQGAAVAFEATKFR